MPDSVWVEGKGWVKVSEASGDDLASRRDYEWIAGRPAETLKGISGARKPALRVGLDLADLERLVAKDEWIGPRQRAAMLKEIRALAAWAESRRGGRDAE